MVRVIREARLSVRGCKIEVCTRVTASESESRNGNCRWKPESQVPVNQRMADVGFLGNG